MTCPRLARSRHCDGLLESEFRVGDARFTYRNLVPC